MQTPKEPWRFGFGQLAGKVASESTTGTPIFAEVFSPQEYFPIETGLAPKKERVSKTNNVLRLGDAERGLQFHSNAAIQRLIPSGEVFRVRYEFIKKPIQLSVADSRKFTIHWQALPVKPRSKLYRQIHIDDAVWTTKKKQQPFHITPVYTEGWNRQWNYHNFWNRAVFKEDFVKKLKERVQQAWKRDRNAFCMYMNITTFDANTPEYRRYRFEWVGDAAEYTPPNPSTREQKKQTMINSHSKTFLDFSHWKKFAPGTRRMPLETSFICINSGAGKTLPPPASISGRYWPLTTARPGPLVALAISRNR